jgi:hypothetical protein
MEPAIQYVTDAGEAQDTGRKGCTASPHQVQPTLAAAPLVLTGPTHSSPLVSSSPQTTPQAGP